jgi:hypothetical protein
VSSRLSLTISSYDNELLVRTALPFLSNTEVFLFPIAAIIAIYVFNFAVFPFGLGWNASRIVAYIYFEN